jgi:2-polyprenyl-3-methyl-5-hydroxy-6-metoxy-1,4-benzoquinol methylase
MPTSVAHCPLCQSESNDIVESFGPLEILRCPECTLEFCDPLEYCREDYDRAYKDESREFYVPSSAWLSEANGSLSESQWMLFSAQVSALRWIQSTQPNASILDIGCGSGWFIARARELGFKVCGVEVGSRPVKLLNEKGFEVVCGSVEAIPANWKPDVVTLFEVLEHLPDPVGFLAQIRQRFPDSIFILSVPSPRRWTKAGKHRDVADYPPNHLTRWNADSLHRALSRVGYSHIHVTHPPPSALETASVSVRGLVQSWFGQMPSTLSEAISAKPLRPLKQEVTTRKLKCIPGFLFAHAFRFAGWSGISMLGIARP